MTDTTLLIFRLVLFGVFALASISKLLDRAGSKKAVRDFGVPEDLVRPVAAALPIMEAVIALGLLYVTSSWLAAIGAFLLLLAFSIGMIAQMAAGKAPDCHCFGQVHSEPVGPTALIRNIVLALLAGVLIWSGSSFQGPPIGATDAEIVQATVLFFLAVLGIVLLGYLIKVIKRQDELVRRLGMVEAFDESVFDTQERNEAGDPSDGLPIGAPLPDFAIPELNGRIMRVDDLLMTHKPSLFLFVGPTCVPCEGLLAEFDEWEEALGDRVNIVYVSSGDVESNKKKFGKHGRLVLVEKERTFAPSVRAKWTPSAIFVDANGNIASHLAAGDVAVRRLAGMVMNAPDLGSEFLYFLGLSGAKRPNIGQSIPDFVAMDTRGRAVDSREFAGVKTLVAFSSAECPHCDVLMDEIREWERARGPHDPRLVIFTDNAQKVKDLGLESPVIEERDYKVAMGLGMRGVPSAVVINEDGVIATEAGIGSEAIWSLIGGRG